MIYYRAVIFCCIRFRYVCLIHWRVHRLQQTWSPDIALCICAGSNVSLCLLDGGFESVTRIVCFKDCQERMLLFAGASNNGMQRAPVTQDQASCWVLRRREKTCASSAPLTLKDSRGKKVTHWSSVDTFQELNSQNISNNFVAKRWTSCQPLWHLRTSMRFGDCATGVPS